MPCNQAESRTMGTWEEVHCPSVDLFECLPLSRTDTRICTSMVLLASVHLRRRQRCWCPPLGRSGLTTYLLGWCQIARDVDNFWILTRTEFHPQAPKEIKDVELSGLLEPSAAPPLTTYFIRWEAAQQLHDAITEAQLPVAKSPHHAVSPGLWAHS